MNKAQRRRCIERAVKEWSSISARRQGWALHALQIDTDRYVKQYASTASVAQKWLDEGAIKKDSSGYPAVLRMASLAKDYAAEMLACKHALEHAATGQIPPRLTGIRFTKFAAHLLRVEVGDYGPADLKQQLARLDRREADGSKLRYHEEPYAEQREMLTGRLRAAKIRTRPIYAAADLIDALRLPVPKGTDTL
jgi:hypothetical protein